MSKYKNKIISSKNYYDNVLLTLGLSKFYIYYNNYYYFGNREIDDQKLANTKIDNIICNYNDFVNYLLNKYDRKVLILEIGIIYDKRFNKRCSWQNGQKSLRCLRIKR